MGGYLLDNNAISLFFSGQLSENGMGFVAEVIDNKPIISVITQIEDLSWITKDKSKEKIVKEFVNDAEIISLSLDIVAQCVKIRRSRKMKTPDAIIAATAIVLQYTLISSDNDFNSIPALKVLNPKEL